MNVESLTELLNRVGPAHHEAFAGTGGDDPDWAGWYAAWLIGHLLEDEQSEEGRSLPDVKELAGWLSAAADEHRASGTKESWPPFYARFIVAQHP